jgi:hypothetical protein
MLPAWRDTSSWGRRSYQLRQLKVAKLSVLKTSPRKLVRAAVAPFAAKIDVRLFQYYWALMYETASK